MAQEIDEVHFRLLLENFRGIIWQNKFKYGEKNGKVTSKEKLHDYESCKMVSHK